MDAVPNARFWDFVNGGWVKITLKPFTNAVHKGRWLTLEGRVFSVHVYSHVGDRVIATWCDSTERGYCGGQSRCELAKLQSRNNVDPITGHRLPWNIPAWECGERWAKEAKAG